MMSLGRHFPWDWGHRDMAVGENIEKREGIPLRGPVLPVRLCAPSVRRVDRRDAALEAGDSQTRIPIQKHS